MNIATVLQVRDFEIRYIPAQIVVDQPLLPSLSRYVAEITVEEGVLMKAHTVDVERDGTTVATNLPIWILQRDKQNIDGIREGESSCWIALDSSEPLYASDRLYSSYRG